MTDQSWSQGIPINLSNEDFASLQKEGEIKIADFKTGISENKLISTVVDTEFIVDDNKKYKYLATYIGDRDQITCLKISQYKKTYHGSNPRERS